MMHSGLSNSDLVELTAFRRLLHRYPEISGEEWETAARIVAALEPLSPSRILTGLGGHGVAAAFDSGVAGPTVLFRAELDALPIQEINDLEWVSQVPGKGHLCGHDGHMTILLALGRLLSRHPVARGRVVLMFQPSEEDGAGARAVVADPPRLGLCHPSGTGAAFRLSCDTGRADELRLSGVGDPLAGQNRPCGQSRRRGVPRAGGGRADPRD